jgi:hypothetical protein
LIYYPGISRFWEVPSYRCGGSAVAKATSKRGWLIVETGRASPAVTLAVQARKYLQNVYKGVLLLSTPQIDIWF